MRTTVRFGHNRHNCNLWLLVSAKYRVGGTPDAVRTGFAFSFGRRYFFHWSGMAAMISTNLGWVDNLNFFAERDLRALRLTDWFCSCAEIRSRAISAQAFARDSFCMLTYTISIRTHASETVIVLPVLAPVTKSKKTFRLLTQTALHLNRPALCVIEGSQVCRTKFMG